MTLKNSRHEQMRWAAERGFRDREINIAEREQVNREAELELKRKEQKSSGWRSPLVVAVIAATLAATGNGVVSFVNARLQRQLERERSEQARILEMIKTGDPDKAADNLEFLLKAGLITETEQQSKLKEFLSTREPGSGPTLPIENPVGALRSITGKDDAIEVNKLGADSNLKKRSMAVGQIKANVKSNDNAMPFQCTAFLIEENLAITASFCVDKADTAELLMYDGATELRYEVNLPPVEISPSDDELNYALLRIKGKPGVRHGVLGLSSQSPSIDQTLSLLMFRGSNQQLAITGTPECRVSKIEKTVFHHRCDTGAGSSGAPILNSDGSQAIGIHYRRDGQGGVATRIDTILLESVYFRSKR